MIDALLAHHWTFTLLLALAASVVALVVHEAARAVLRRLVPAGSLPQALLAASTRSAGALLHLVALQAVWETAADDLRLIGAVRHGNAVLLIGAASWFIIALIGGLAQWVRDRHPVTVADNLQARRVHTQTTVLSRTAMVVVGIAGAALALMTFPGARQLGASLLASAGVLGLVVGIAARPVFGNLIAGLQLALAQPIRLDDVLIVEGEWGRVEEITGSYVVLRIWDERRLVIPLQYFIERPFQNWTRNSAQLHQPVYLFVDFATPLQPLRDELRRIVENAAEWDGRTATLVVVDTNERAMKVRALVSAPDAGRAFELGCKVREGLLAFIAREHPECLPQVRPAAPLSHALTHA